MKPSKMRNKLIHKAVFNERSKQLGSNLSEELSKKYGKKTVRVIEGDSVKIIRGEFKGVDGKIAKTSTMKSSVAIEGIKKEKTKGDKFDVYIHSSNLLVTNLNTNDKWRIEKLEGKKSVQAKKTTEPQKNIPEKTIKEKVPKEKKSNITKINEAEN